MLNLRQPKRNDGDRNYADRYIVNVGYFASIIRVEYVFLSADTPRYNFTEHQPKDNDNQCQGGAMSYQTLNHVLFSLRKRLRSDPLHFPKQ